ncbi:mechanosensitive ion channel domain-containing protein [Georgenia sp. MJ206]|uniref:mechanosensitive ion channel family protein n=1 Tax=Georgenia wangjunii TaxID=3117730 RepID=UPI002F262A50
MDEPSETTIVDDAGRAVGSFLGPVVGAAIGMVVALVVSWLVGLAVRRLGRRHPVAARVTERCRRPFRFTAAVIGAWVGFVIATPVAPGEIEPSWRSLTQHGLIIVLILAATWLATSIVFVAEDAVDQRYGIDRSASRHARRVQTQAQMIRRVVVAVLWVCGLAAILMTFPGARAVGASVLASAGVISIVAGLAAQTALANVFAGMQLAFTDAMRVDDVVVIEGEFGRVEEITLTYVVVHLWDDRRLIMPSTYFTSTPFENWTRRAAEILGTVELDLDWRVPVADLRAEFTRLLEATDMWDRRSGGLQLTEATGGWVRARAVVSAENAGVLFDLRCYVREGLVDWVQREAPYALPRTRVETEAATPSDDERTTGDRRPGTGRAGAAVDGTDRRTRKGGTVDREARDGAAAKGDGGKVDAGREGATGAERTGPARSGKRSGPPVRTSLHTRGGGPDIEHDARFFTSVEGIDRAKMFAGPGEDVIAEREQNAQRARARETDVEAPDEDERGR